jgi:prevent-host-death family protein
MKITAKELRGKPGQIIEQAARGTEVIITIRGKKMARLVPYKTKTSKDKSLLENEDELFGIWKDRPDVKTVDDFVRASRKGRTF